MDPILIGLLAGAGTGVLKNELIDRPEADRYRKQQSEVARWSPWTGMAPDLRLHDPNVLGSALQFGGTGAMLGGSYGAMQNQKGYLDAMRSGAAPAAGASPGVASSYMGMEQGPYGYYQPQPTPWTMMPK